MYNRAPCIKKPLAPRAAVCLYCGKPLRQRFFKTKAGYSVLESKKSVAVRRYCNARCQGAAAGKG